MANLIQHPYAQALAWALVHFLWQGALLGLLAFVAMRLLGAKSTARYAVGVVTLAAMLATPVATVFYIIQSSGEAAAVTSPGSSVLGPASRQDASISGPTTTPDSGLRTPNSELWTASSGPWTFSLLAVWFAGVSVLSLRLLRSWIAARRLATRAVRPAAPDIQILARRVAARLALDRIVHVFESSAVVVPMMVGWMKPVVLLPTAALSGLTPAQVEALLAHELAHICRHDYVINLLQTVVETLLFYHPAVWWVSRQVRTEREHCCDDVAVSVCDRLVYATALAELAAMTSTPRLALAATDGSLVKRVRRILGVPAAGDEGAVRPGWLGVLILVLSVGLIVPVALASKRPPTARADQQGSVQQVVPAGSAQTPATEVQPEPAEPPLVAVNKEGLATFEPQDAQAQTPEDLRKLETRLMEQQRAAQQDIELRRLELERAQLDLEMKARLTQAQAELDMLRKRHDEVKRQFDVGLVNRGTLAEIDNQVAMAEQQLVRAAREQELRKSEFEIRRKEVEMRSDVERRQMELEKVRSELIERSQSPRGELEQARRIRQLLEELTQALDDKRLRIDGLDLKVAQNRLRETEPLPAEQAIDPGMVLMIEISGEPDLPRQYTVLENGTIRLPLLGAVKVVGRTAAQVQADIRMLLTDRRLGEKATVEVSAHRRIRR